MARGRPKGLPKTGGGSRKGIPNKVKADIEAKLAALKCDPIEGMAIIAAQARSSGDLALAGKMYAELAQYVAPKRKAVEHTGVDGARLEVIILNGIADDDEDSDPE